jgi:hypothetical protein
MDYIKMIGGIPFVIGSVTFNLSQVTTIIAEDETTIYISVGSSFVRVVEHKDAKFFSWVKDTFLPIP